MALSQPSAEVLVKKYAKENEDTPAFKLRAIVLLKEEHEGVEPGDRGKQNLERQGSCECENTQC